MTGRPSERQGLRGCSLRAGSALCTVCSDGCSQHSPACTCTSASAGHLHPSPRTTMAWPRSSMIQRRCVLECKGPSERGRQPLGAASHSPGQPTRRSHGNMTRPCPARHELLLYAGVGAAKHRARFFFSPIGLALTWWVEKGWATIASDPHAQPASTVAHGRRQKYRHMPYWWMGIGIWGGLQRDAHLPLSPPPRPFFA